MILLRSRWQDVVPADVSGRVVVVLDVLRWSSVVVSALSAGAPWVEAFATPELALARASSLGRSSVLLGGERGNVALPGFDLGNSPLEYTSSLIAGRGVITTTTNGTQALLAAVGAREVLVGCFLNLGAVDERLRLLLGSGVELTIIAAGQAGEEALEDTGCGGAIIAALRASNPTIELDADAARALSVWREHNCDPTTLIAAAPHAESLRRAGFTADLARAAELDALPLLLVADPRDGRVVSMSHEAGRVASFGEDPQPVDMQYATIPIERMTVEERLNLIGRLWDSLEPESASPVTAELAAELDAISRNAEAHPEQLRTWTDVREELRKKLP